MTTESNGTKMSFNGRPRGARFILMGPHNNGRPKVYFLVNHEGDVVLSGLDAKAAEGYVKSQKYGDEVVTAAQDSVTGQTLGGRGVEGKPNGKTARRKAKKSS